MQTTVIQACGNRENIVEIFAVKHLRQSGFNPLVAPGTLTFGTVPVPATVIRNMQFATFITLFNMTAKRRSAAIFKRIQYPFVISQNRVPEIEILVVATNNIRDFILWVHPKNCKAYLMDFSPF
jgi:hypothetical protein